MDIRRARGLSLKREDCMKELSDEIERIYTNPRNLPFCPACSQPPHFEVFPQFNYAHRCSTPEKRKHIFIGCQHMAKLLPAFSFVDDEQMDAFGEKWKREIEGIFEQKTAGWTDEQKAARKIELELA